MNASGSRPSVLAIGAHPDDIEFMMAGTLLMLRDAGWSPHVMNIANGNCGTAVEPSEKIIARRGAEAREAARLIGAGHYGGFCNNLDVYLTTDLY